MPTRTGCLLLLLSMTMAAGAQQFEFAVSGANTLCHVLSRVDEYAVFHPFEPPRPDLAREDIVTEHDIRMIASGPGGVVYGMRPTTEVVRFSNGAATPFFGGIPEAFALGIAVAPSGGTYLSLIVARAPHLAVVSPAGAQEAIYPLPGAGGGFGQQDAILAVAPDGCTVFYATATAIRRINGCTGAPLMDFVALSAVNDIEVLPGGELLVSAGSRVLHYSSSGVLIGTVASLSSYGFGTDVTVEEAALANGILWILAGESCRNSTLLRVSVDTGAEVRPRLHVPLVTGSGLIVSRGSHANVPVAGELGLILLGLALAGGGVLVLKLRAG